MKGDYFVNDDCIGCTFCIDVAPENFDIKDMRAFVIKQPSNDKEREHCKGAKEECPMEAIKRKINQLGAGLAKEVKGS